jgi:hypothetical protein
MALEIPLSGAWKLKRDTWCRLFCAGNCEHNLRTQFSSSNFKWRMRLQIAIALKHLICLKITPLHKSAFDFRVTIHYIILYYDFVPFASFNWTIESLDSCEIYAYRNNSNGNRLEYEHINKTAPFRIWPIYVVTRDDARHKMAGFAKAEWSRSIRMWIGALLIWVPETIEVR